MTLIQSSLPNSVEATLSFESSHGEKEFLCNWTPGAEAWQECQRCGNHSKGGHERAVPVTKGNNNDGDLDSLSFQQNCSQLSTMVMMSEKSKPTFVYQRKKLQRDSTTVFTAQSSAKAKASDNSLSAVSSSEAPSVAAKEHIVSLVELDTEAVRAPGVLPVECNRGTPVSKPTSINGYSLGIELGSVDDPKHDMLKVVDVCCVNDSFSSSKSNINLYAANSKTEVDDTGECSSSGAVIMEGLQDDLSEKDVCISILRSLGLLKGVFPFKPCASSEGVGISSHYNCWLSCKVCDQSETTLKMLICDQCEEAFHVSCCSPRIKKLTLDEWFCHSCLKKKRKILKETTIRESQNFSSEMGRFKNATSQGSLGPIEIMFSDTKPYTTNVRIGPEYQVEVPDWSGPVLDADDHISEPFELNPSECASYPGGSSSKLSRLSSIGNWLQCREVIDGVGEGVEETICGKWRRAPLFEVQTDDWECFRSVLWDPTHADCAVPQELDTDQVLKQLKYIEMLRPRLAAKTRKSSSTRNVDLQEPTKDVRNPHKL